MERKLIAASSQVTTTLEGDLFLSGGCTRPWAFIGDFNVVHGNHEKRDDLTPNPISCWDILNWINNNNLVHVHSSGAQFTWMNKRKGAQRIEMKLDQAISNTDYLDAWDSINCRTLARVQSDHEPLLTLQNSDSE
ncbi:hypothetical protein Fmac_025688 [Flemingia macrophylla]|uniref:Uncharacterized protein n=1 Tax=Flemingia macrophylla TaxID=520843 RepID=A0ABD1LUS1_9FABA